MRTFKRVCGVEGHTPPMTTTDKLIDLGKFTLVVIGIILLAVFCLFV